MADKLNGFNINSQGYGTVPKIVMQDRNLNITAKALYAYFCSYTGAGNTCFPTRKKICYDLGISTDTFTKYLKELTDREYLIIEQKRNDSTGRFLHNVYTLPDTILPGTENAVSEITGHGKMDTINNIPFKNNNDIKKSNNIMADFENLWEIYPRKIGKKKALDAYARALKKGVSFETIKKGIENYNKQIKANGTAPAYIKHGSTWFNGECWNDEYITSSQPKETPQAAPENPEFDTWINNFMNDGKEEKQ